MRGYLTILLQIFFCICANGQTKYLKSEESVKELSKKVAGLFKEDKISAAFDELKGYWPLPENEVEGIQEKTIKYINLIGERFGNTIGVLKVKEEKIGEIAIRETYLVRYQYSAIRLIFTYYKNENGWIVNAFKWDDSYTEEFK
jgi:hypothetical protein